MLLVLEFGPKLGRQKWGTIFICALVRIVVHETCSKHTTILHMLERHVLGARESSQNDTLRASNTDCAALLGLEVVRSKPAEFRKHQHQCFDF